MCGMSAPFQAPGAQELHKEHQRMRKETHRWSQPGVSGSDPTENVDRDLFCGRPKATGINFIWTRLAEALKWRHPACPGKQLVVGQADGVRLAEASGGESQPGCGAHGEKT